LYPVFSVLNLFSSLGCMTQGGFDLAYLTAFDPLWSNDELSFLLHPEIALVANPVAQASCAADAVASSGGFGINELFWCAGSWGSVYPLTGNNGATGDLPAVYALSAVKLLAKLHNELLAFKTTGEGSLCAARPHRVIVKNQYKLQLAFPKNTRAFPIGRVTARWAAGKWYPGQGEDWVLVLWRKKDCCLL
ncbi:MAG: conjugal transfer protein, partial [Candidatus Dadabacteria bacterium]|nr:conjugal transfer protein [Candidatus Dadabacteria bacterium]